MKPEKATQDLDKAIEVTQIIVDGLTAANEFAGESSWRHEDLAWVNRQFTKYRRMLEAFQRAKLNIERS